MLQDIPEVGLGPARPPTTSSASQAEPEYTTIAEQDEENLIDTIEADDQVTGKEKDIPIRTVRDRL